MSRPTTEQIPRRGRGTGLDDDSPAVPPGPVPWSDVETSLRAGSGTTWLSIGTASGVHSRPVFAAWTGEAFVLASKSSAVKTRHLDESDGTVSLAIDLGKLHLVVEGPARRLTAAADLERASTAMADVYDWPTTVAGDELDAPYGAPTSGGPPYRVYEVAPARAFVFPADGLLEPTRYTW